MNQPMKSRSNTFNDIYISLSLEFIGDVKLIWRFFISWLIWSYGRKTEFSVFWFFSTFLPPPTYKNLNFCLDRIRMFMVSDVSWKFGEKRFCWWANVSILTKCYTIVTQNVSVLPNVRTNDLIHGEPISLPSSPSGRSCLNLVYYHFNPGDAPASHLPNVLGHRVWRWPSTDPTVVHTCKPPLPQIFYFRRTTIQQSDITDEGDIRLNNNHRFDITENRVLEGQYHSFYKIDSEVWFFGWSK